MKGPYFAFIFVLAALMMSPVVLAAHNENHTGEGGGLPEANDRIALVEKVLEVEKITKQPEFTLHGTDYQPEDDGKILAYVLVGQQPVTDALCEVSVLYPNNSIFIDSQMMFEIPNSDFAGMYFYDFTVPNTTGVYPVAALCIFGTTQITDLVDTEDGNLTEAVGSEGLLALSPDESGSQDFTGGGTCDGPGGSDINCQWQWNVTLPSGALTEFLDDFRIILRAHTDASENFLFSAFDYNASTWINFANFTQGSPNEPTTIQFPINGSYISPDDDVTIRTSVQEFDSPQFLEVYDLYVSRTYNATFIQDMRGSNEIVVSERVFNASLDTADILEILTTPQEFLNDQISLGLILIFFFLIMLVAQQFVWAGLMLLAWSLIYGFDISTWFGIVTLAVALGIAFLQTRN